VSCFIDQRQVIGAPAAGALRVVDRPEVDMGPIGIRISPNMRLIVTPLTPRRAWAIACSNSDKSVPARRGSSCFFSGAWLQIL
jgi:hypothetical protein